MTVPRQGKSSETGRVNQKRRTRGAIVDAAKALLQQGVTPTVADAAEAALVSRTTAYRYFPTQESLLLELSMHLDVEDIEALVAEPVDAEGALDRVLDVLDRFNRHVRAEERQYRTALGVYQDLWLEAITRGDDAPVVREGRRGRWLETSLAPLADDVPPADLERLIRALSMVTGPEAMIVLYDVCHLAGEDALDVSRWAARVLLEATFGHGATPGASDSVRRPGPP
jgi:AcrR family transcriptional regulator